jgi:hypothetical protein
MKSLIERIDAFTARTGMKIAAPYNNPSGKWEVSEPNGTVEYNNGFAMMDALEARYRDDTA